MKGAHLVCAWGGKEVDKNTSYRGRNGFLKTLFSPSQERPFSETISGKAANFQKFEV
jgi:hypothetical protein